MSGDYLFGLLLWAFPVADVQLVGRDQRHDFAVPEVVILAVRAHPAQLLFVEILHRHFPRVFLGDVRMQVERAGVAGIYLELGGEVVLEERRIDLPEHEAAGDANLGARVEFLRCVADGRALRALALIRKHTPAMLGAECIDFLGARAHGVLNGQLHAVLIAVRVHVDVLEKHLLQRFECRHASRLHKPAFFVTAPPERADDIPKIPLLGVHSRHQRGNARRSVIASRRHNATRAVV